MHKRRRIVLGSVLVFGLVVGWSTNNAAWARRVESAKQNSHPVPVVEVAKIFPTMVHKAEQPLLIQTQKEDNSLSDVPENFRGDVVKASQEFSVPVSILAALGRIESNWDCTAVGPDQDTGCFQVIPSTGAWAMKELGIEGADLLDPAVNIRVGAWVLKTFANSERGDWAIALADFNAGPGAWDRAPVVSRGYAARVLSRAVETNKSR
jgi:soluble lytic murein transglycosylase-like protein